MKTLSIIELEKIIKINIKILSELQQNDGSFLHSSISKKGIKYHTHKSPFFSSLISLCLHSVKDIGTQVILKKSVSYIISQQNESLSINYKDKKSQDKDVFPDDLDDSFCALSAIYLYDSSKIDGKVVAKAVELLINTEIKVGGPYNTWLLDYKEKSKWHNIDVVVNINILYFLSLLGTELPNLYSFIEENIQKETLKSPYYISEIVSIYFLSRYYKGLQTKTLVSRLKIFFYKESTSLLEKALIITALLNLEVNENIEKVFTNFVEIYKKTDISNQAFIVEKITKKDVFCASSEAFTRAVIIETVQKIVNFKYHTTMQKQKIKIQNSILDRVKERISNLDCTFRDPFSKILNQLILKKPNYEMITLLPYYFSMSLKDPHKVSLHLCADLGLANVYGWLAYTIYDNFLDGEGDPKTLNIANFCLRELTLLFSNSIYTKEFLKKFNSVMDAMEQANLWEVSRCRFDPTKTLALEKFSIRNFKNNKVLAEKSMPHSFGVMALLFNMGITDNSEEFKLIENFFTHYLIAKQLNDDALDWYNDLMKGQITWVNAQVMLALKMQEIILNLQSSKNLKKMQKLYTNTVVYDISVEMKKQITLAKHSIKKSSIIYDFTLYENLTSSLEKSADRLLNERKFTKDFIKQYLKI